MWIYVIEIKCSWVKWERKQCNKGKYYFKKPLLPIYIYTHTYTFDILEKNIKSILYMGFGPCYELNHNMSYKMVCWNLNPG